jgi:hypothetical protein
VENAQADEFAAARAVWAGVAADVQAEIDDEVVRGATLRALVALRDRGGAADLLLGRAVLAYRRDALIGTGRIALLPDPTVDQVLAAVAAVEEQPVAVEVGWAGESVLLCVIVARHGEFDERLVGTVQRRDRAEAARVARDAGPGGGRPTRAALSLH